MVKVFMNAIIVELSLIGMGIYGNVKIAIMKVYVFLGAGILIMMTLKMMNIVKMAFQMSIKVGLANIMDNGKYFYFFNNFKRSFSTLLASA